MFDGFAHVWTPLVTARSLGRTPLGLTLAGERVVLFRDARGQVGALIDRCPHRGVALSLGHVAPDGCLECPFHGWRFDRTGANRHVPFNPQARRETLGATPIPVRELGDLIWVYTAPGATAPVEPQPPEGLIAPGLRRTLIARTWACHWTRAMENMLDSPHLPFVHRATIGKPVRRRMTPTSTMEITWEDTAFGGRSRAILDGDDKGAHLEFHRPNIMALHIPIPGRHLRIHALVIPVDQATTRLMVVASRDFAKLGLLEPFFARMNARIADEDRAVVESSQPSEVPPLAQEHSVATDRATREFRRYYFETLRPSAA
ncbi:aromatic ring-hydroxylating oxygenase subunit alpha [Phenylobacterium aquaticum]|uniref:aromatic ring-hydroxylating oxygenase subunit alpha n=1 Tax=Phenylobacterium aquaticum TaxID=1763816 RepID=UPI001F5C680F|nr:aromatic ring-hydroxylating dioxygenase subunit alpha [Phenylobacterium aquaticum]MCI3135000.1 aromatic ring-hydroxylating dioxygenase subunit alpha [Phenylobacterium aquaticum]